MCDFLKSIDSNFAQVNKFNRKSDIHAMHSHFQIVITDRCHNSRCLTHEHWAAATRAAQLEPWPRPLSVAGPSWLRSEITLRSNVTWGRKHSYAGKISPGGNNTSFLDLIKHHFINEMTIWLLSDYEKLVWLPGPIILLNLVYSGVNHFLL